MQHKLPFYIVTGRLRTAEKDDKPDYSYRMLKCTPYIGEANRQKRQNNGNHSYSHITIHTLAAPYDAKLSEIKEILMAWCKASFGGLLVSDAYDTYMRIREADKEIYYFSEQARKPFEGGEHGATQN